MRTIDSAGKIFSRSLGAVTLILIGLLVIHGLVLEPQRDRSFQSMQVLRQRHEVVLAQQIGLQGSALTGDARYLEVYPRNADLLNGGGIDAFELTSLDRRAAELYLELRLAEQAWIDGAMARLDSTTSRGAEGPQRGSVEREIALFDAYLQSHERIMTELSVDHQAATNAQLLALYAAFGATVLIMLSATILSFRRTRRLREAVGEPLSALLARIDEISSGDAVPNKISGDSAEFEVVEFSG